ncbi:MAG: ABC transporter substrate-binding protein, partial [Hyphomicrobium sp.]
MKLAGFGHFARVMRAKSLRRTAAILATLLAMSVGASAPAAVQATDDAEAAQRPPVVVPIFFTSKSDDCYDSGIVAAIKRVASLAQGYINRTGGIAGRQIVTKLYDDKRDPQLAVRNFAEAISDPQTVAMIGLTSATRAKAAFDAAGKDLRARNIPFLSDISVGSLIANYPSVFTTRPSEDEERMPVIINFVKEMKFGKIAFVGLQDNVASASLGDSLKQLLGADAIVADHRLKLANDKLNAADVAATIDDLKSKNPDLVFLSIGGDRLKEALNQFKTASFAPSIFAT